MHPTAPPRPATRPHRYRRARVGRGGWRALALALAASTVLAGCSGAGSDRSTVTDDTGAPVGATDEAAEVAPSTPDGHEEAAEAGEDAAGVGGEPSLPGPDGNVTGEHVVRTAEITLEMEDTERSLAEVRRVAERVGGVVATADLRRDRHAGDLGGVIVVRVPSPELLGTLDGLEELAVDAPVRRIDERDVTSEVVDLAARVTNLTAYEDELRVLLTEIREGTSDADRLLPVFERVQEVRSEIDRLTAQRDALADRVARSTITVTVRPAPGAEPVPTTTWAPQRTLERALATTVAAVTTLADGAIWLVVVALPVTLLLLGPPLGAVWAWRRRRPRRDASPSGGGAPAGTATDAPSATGGAG